MANRKCTLSLDRRIRTRKATVVLTGIVLCCFPLISAVPAAELDDFGPPPAGDPSAQTGPFIGLQFAGDNLVLCVGPNDPPGCNPELPPANEGSLLLQGGIQGTIANVGVNNEVPFPGVEKVGRINIPSDSRPSPLFGARSFTQQMLLFEEFGTEPLNDNTPLQAGLFPNPTDNQTGPAPAALY